MQHAPFRKHFWFFSATALMLAIAACSGGNDATSGSSDAASDQSASDDATSTTAGGLSGGMLFRVNVPANTPPEDEITLWLQGNIPVPMQEAAPGVFTATVTAQTEPGAVRYRYTRNQFNFPGAEYLEPDRNDYFWSQYGRSVSFSAGTTQTDTITRWRWFPASGTWPTTVPSLTAGPISPRTTGAGLSIGAYLADLWEPAFALTLTATANRLHDRGFRYALLSPPWQVSTLDPVPEIDNLIDENPNYPDDKLAAQVRSLADAGIDVIMQPQVHPKGYNIGSRPASWWDAWFSTLTAMHVHHAKIAAANGARFYAFYPDGLHNDPPDPNADSHWRSLLQAVRNVFPGQVGINIWQFSDAGGTSYVIPATTAISFWDAIDFISYQISGQLVPDASPTDEQLADAASGLLAPVVAVARLHSLPITVEPSYASVARSWRGTSFYSVNLQNAVYDGEDEWQQGTWQYSDTDQARVMHAFMAAAATTPEVLAVLPFGYWPMDFPLSPDFSVRAKAAELILMRWTTP
ncbi:MAG: hypothetical protein D6761_04630 [Candidatus Dadabacteria bacterium]|nr:MAG: hypothetical protein D6761_04630 [Candidatus Dadabacteria bacterium]